MYHVKLNLSHFPAQSDAEVLNITVGDLLHKTAASHPNAVAMVDIADNGDCGQSSTFGGARFASGKGRGGDFSDV